jgi:hypothetical protein
VGTKRVFPIASFVVALVGLVLLRMRVAPAEESFYRSEIWLPHAAMSEVHPGLPPWEGPIPGARVSLDEARARAPFPIALPSYMPEGGALREVYVSGTDNPRLYRQAALVYDNGVYIILRYGGMAWSWESPFRQRFSRRCRVLLRPLSGRVAACGRVDGRVLTASMGGSSVG